MIISELLYHQIKQCMPIPCVDLLVKDENNQILLVKSKNESAAGQWWFSRGRVYFGESRNNAAIRKLKEECLLQLTGQLKRIIYTRFYFRIKEW